MKKHFTKVIFAPSHSSSARSVWESACNFHPITLFEHRLEEKSFLFGPLEASRVYFIQQIISPHTHMQLQGFVRNDTLLHLQECSMQYGCTNRLLSDSFYWFARTDSHRFCESLDCERDFRSKREGCLTGCIWFENESCVLFWKWIHIVTL